jgi:hypothetical protein
MNFYQTNTIFIDGKIVRFIIISFRDIIAKINNINKTELNDDFIIDQIGEKKFMKLLRIVNMTKSHLDGFIELSEYQLNFLTYLYYYNKDIKSYKDIENDFIIKSLLE